jgi:hypothetical protein
MFTSELVVIKTVLVILLMFTLPGWAFLSVSNYFNKWENLQKWIIAISLSIAFYPILFYIVRYIFPDFQIGPNKLIALGILFIATIIFNQKKAFLNQFKFDKLEILAIILVLITLSTRLIALNNHQYPAWTDSLHHTLLTELTATNGRLPYTLIPYEPADLSMYHLGLYSITGSLQMLANIPAYSALQWIAQILSGLSGIGIYLFLDKYLNRRSAIIGLIIVGLFSFQPNWYFNWGRYTQLASQVILMTGIVIVWESLKKRADYKKNWFKFFCLVLGASILNAGIFFLHFRVAIFYFLGLFIIVVYEFWKNFNEKQLTKFLIRVLLIILISLVLILPILINAANVYFERATNLGQQISNSTADLSAYYFPFTTTFFIGLKPWLFYLTLAVLIISLLLKNKFAIWMAIWIVLLYSIGYAYKINIPQLMVTNIGAVLIMLYIPSSIIIGVGFDELKNSRFKRISDLIFIAVLICTIPFSVQRTKDIEPSRFFITDDDIEAMDWIKYNIPANSIIGIRPYFWLSDYPHGIDSGIWIPYFTGLKTNMGTMLFRLSPEDYQEMVIYQSTLLADLYDHYDPSILNDLCFENIPIVYEKNNSILFLNDYINLGKMNIIFENKGVKVVKIKCELIN